MTKITDPLTALTFKTLTLCKSTRYVNKSKACKIIKAENGTQLFLCTLQSRREFQRGGSWLENSTESFPGYWPGDDQTLHWAGLVTQRHHSPDFSRNIDQGAVTVMFPRIKERVICWGYQLIDDPEVTCELIDERVRILLISMGQTIKS